MNDGRLSVALFLPSLVVGGAERMMLNIAAELSKRGYDVDLVLVNAEGDFLKDVPEEVHLVDLGASRVLTSLPKLIRYLRRAKPDVLLSTITPTNVVSVWATLVPGVNVKHVVRVARPEYEAAEVQDNTKKEKVTAALGRLFYPYADEVVAVSEGVANDLRSNTSMDQIHVIYNPVVTEGLKQRAEEPVNHSWFTEDTPVILGVGRLVDQKDFPTLIRAFALLRKRRDVRLVLFGDGDRRSELERLAKELEIDAYVDMPGFVENPYSYMAKADVFVNSAKHEGFGNVIIEAMACEAPIVATDCPGAPAELLDKGEFGRLVPVGKPEEMADAIKASLDDPTDASVLGDRAEDFSSEKSIDHYAEVLFNE